MESRYALAAIFTLAISIPGLGKGVKKCDLLPAPDNVIDSPSYVATKRCPGSNTDEEEKKTPDKAQYKPGASDGSPSFEDKESPEKEENGAYYNKGNETYVQPDSQYKKTSEVIVDPEEEVPQVPPDK